jgi:Zn-dependent metalloprotease
VIPGAAVYFDRATGLLRKLASPGLAAQAKIPGPAAEAFLRANHRLLGLAADLSDLSLLSSQSSRGGFHVRYQQMVDGMPVWEAQVAVHLSRDLRIQLVQSGVMPIAKPPIAKPRLDSNAAVAIAQAAIGISGNLRGAASAGLVVYADRPPASLCWRALVPAWQPLGDWEVLVDAVSGQAFFARNLLKFVNGSGMVFDPNPISTSRNCTLTDNRDADYAALNDQRVSRTLLGLDGSGYLVGPYVTTAPTRRRAYEPSFIYNYTRADDRFEQVMAYYHTDACQRYLQSLGFSNVNNRAQPVDADGTRQDNSWYSPATGIITYGTGGVDDAEDADVIMHEYGHAIQDNQVPGFGATEEGGAIGEGFGDYLAATRYAEVNWAWRAYIAEWDATAYNPGCPAYLRRVDSAKHYPEDMVGEVHADGEIWSACLWQMREALGAAAADKIIIESHFYLTPTSQFRDGAEAIILADQNLNGGADEAVIREIFSDRGILVELTDAASIAVAHARPSDLKVWLGVVGNPFTPLLVSNRQSETEWIVPLGAYSAYLPPSASHRWYVRVEDFARRRVGEITEFRINWAGTDYVSSNPPVPIPDVGGGPAYAYIP